jgi:transcriptional regulator with XRE-family HTH domain
MTKQQLLKLLWKKVDEAGSQKQLAEQFKISPAYLNDVLNERREPGKSILDALGIKKVVSYE